jgi:hypothetical protein
MSEEVNSGIVKDTDCPSEASSPYPNRWQKGQSGNPAGYTGTKREQNKKLAEAFWRVMSQEGRVDKYWEAVYEEAVVNRVPAVMKILAERMVPAMTHIEHDAPEQTRAVSELSQALAKAWEAQKEKG